VGEGRVRVNSLLTIKCGDKMQARYTQENLNRCFELICPNESRYSYLHQRIVTDKRHSNLYNKLAKHLTIARKLLDQSRYLTFLPLEKTIPFDKNRDDCLRVIYQIIEVMNATKLYLGSNDLSLDEVILLIEPHFSSLEVLDLRENELRKELFNRLRPYRLNNEEQWLIKWNQFKSLLRNSKIIKLDVSGTDLTREQKEELKQIIVENCERLGKEFKWPGDEIQLSFSRTSDTLVVKPNSSQPSPNFFQSHVERPTRKQTIGNFSNEKDKCMSLGIGKH
jgi:hypothetical protein